jgi:CRISPR-associated exonuclease Cas4
MTITDPIPLSALSQYAYCPRRSALLLLENIWEDNEYTLRGTLNHQRVDELSSEMLEGVRVERALPLYHDGLGLSGRADVVEFLADGTLFPVEYKTGKIKRAPNPETAALEKLAADVQLCAQAMCLEHMLRCEVQRGVIYHIGSKKRRDVQFVPTLRQRTLEVVALLRQQLEQQLMPRPVNDWRCEHCSLNSLCMPQISQFSIQNPFVIEVEV